MADILKYNEKIFENIKNINDYDQEFWYARELSEILEYTKWGNFKKVIDKAKEACDSSDINVSNHFADVGKMIDIANGAQREIEDIMLSRYACYLIVQNADSRKNVVALGQTYFATQTIKQELIDDFQQNSEDKKRLAIRNELADHNKSLAEVAQMAGIEDPRDYAVFQNRGYQGLYGGLGAKEIKERKGLKKSHKILDYMGSTELAANLFRATQTDEKLRRENIKGKYKANEVHYKVGAKVRKTIEELGGTMPENLPTPKKSVKAIEKEEQKKLKNNGDLTE